MRIRQRSLLDSHMSFWMLTPRRSPAALTSFLTGCLRTPPLAGSSQSAALQAAVHRPFAPCRSPAACTPSRRGLPLDGCLRTGCDRERSGSSRRSFEYKSRRPAAPFRPQGGEGRALMQGRSRRERPTEVYLLNSSVLRRKRSRKSMHSPLCHEGRGSRSAIQVGIMIRPSGLAGRPPAGGNGDRLLPGTMTLTARLRSACFRASRGCSLSSFLSDPSTPDKSDLNT